MLPAEPEPRPFDVVVVGESAHQLIARCEPIDPAVVQLWEQTALLHGPEAATEWLRHVVVWLGHRLGGDRPWPVPQWSTGA